MRILKGNWKAAVLAALLIAACMLGAYQISHDRDAAAATAGSVTGSGPSPGSPGYEIWNFTYHGPATSTVTPISWYCPWQFYVIRASCSPASDIQSGTNAYTVDLQSGGVSLLASPIPVATPGTIVQGTMAASPVITAGSTVSMILNVSGNGGPSIQDVTCTMAVYRQ